MEGTVAPAAPSSAVSRLRDKGANGSGHLAAATGTGVWLGAGPNSGCSGRWEAERR